MKRIIILILIIFTSSVLPAQRERWDVRKGNKSYERENFSRPILTTEGLWKRILLQSRLDTTCQMFFTEIKMQLRQSRRFQNLFLTLLELLWMKKMLQKSSTILETTRSLKKNGARLWKRIKIL